MNIWLAVFVGGVALLLGWLLRGRRLAAVTAQDEQQRQQRLDDMQRALDSLRASSEQLQRAMEAQNAVVLKLDERTGSLSTDAKNHGQGLTTLISRSEQDLKAQDELRRKVEEAQKLLHVIRADYEARKDDEKRTGEAIRQLHDKMLGSQSKGAAGENFVAEALSALPPEILLRDFTVRGKKVEFALRLGGRVLPMDVKTGENFKKDAEEVKKYIDSAHTTPYVIMAVPDGSYHATRKEHYKVFDEGVRVVPFSLVLPFLMTLLEMERRAARSVDMEALHQRVGDISRLLAELSGKLESHVSRGITQIQNGINECRELVAKLQGNVMHLESMERQPASEDAPAPRALSSP